MHCQHCLGVGSLVGYIGEAMDGLPIRCAFFVVGKSFDIPAILFYLASDANKNKREDDQHGMVSSDSVAASFDITIVSILAAM